MVFSVASHANSAKDYSNSALLITFSPVLTTLTAMGVIHDKEQLEALKADAQDFLAEGEATESLSKAIDSLRDSEKSLSNLSDEEIAAAILSSVE